MAPTSLDLLCQSRCLSMNQQTNGANYTPSLSFLFLFLSLIERHTLPCYASAEACLTGWPNVQPQGRD